MLGCGRRCWGVTFYTYGWAGVGVRDVQCPPSLPPFLGRFRENGFGRLLARFAPGVPSLLRPEAFLDLVRRWDVVTFLFKALGR